MAAGPCVFPAAIVNSSVVTLLILAGEWRWAVTAVDVEEFADLYKGGTSLSRLSDRFGITPEEGARILKKRKIEIRSPGRRTGWRKLSPAEIQRLIETGKESRTWEEYHERSGRPSNYNVRQDRRLGVRLACFKCGSFPAPKMGRIDGMVRQICPSCVKTNG